MPNSLDGYLSELVTTAQACGAWPEMRELQSQCEAAFRDTLRRAIEAAYARGAKQEAARVGTYADKLRTQLANARKAAQ